MEWDVYVWFCFESDNLGGRFQFLKHQLHDALRKATVSTEVLVPNHGLLRQ